MPAQNDLTILRDGIRRFSAERKHKLTLSYLSLLIQSVKNEVKAAISEGKTIERPALLSAIDVFFDAYASVIGTCPQSYYFQAAFFNGLNGMMPADDNPLPYGYHSVGSKDFQNETADIDHRALVANFKPGKRAAVELHFYVSNDDPEHALFQELLQHEQGTFREEIALCRLNQQRWQAVSDHVLVAQFGKMLNTLAKAQLTISTAEADHFTASDLDSIGVMLRAKYLEDFAKPAADWREVLTAQLDAEILAEATGPFNQYYPAIAGWADDARRGELMATVLRLLYLASSDQWYDDALLLVKQFAPIVRAIIADGLDRDAILERFLGAGAAERYPAPKCLS